MFEINESLLQNAVKIYSNKLNDLIKNYGQDVISYFRKELETLNILCKILQGDLEINIGLEMIGKNLLTREEFNKKIVMFLSFEKLKIKTKNWSSLDYKTIINGYKYYTDSNNYWTI